MHYHQISWSSFARLSFLILQWNHLNTKNLHTLILKSSCLLKGIFSKFHFLYLANLNEWISISPEIFRKPTGFLLFYYFRGKKFLLENIFIRAYYRGVFRTLSNIKNGAFCENNSWLLCVNCFCITLYLRCLTGFLMHLCIFSKIAKFR